MDTEKKYQLETTIGFQLAKLTKVKGFDEKCKKWFTDDKKVNDHILVYAVLRKIFEDEPEMLKIVADIKYDENYKKAYDLSENYEEILKWLKRCRRGIAYI